MEKYIEYLLKNYHSLKAKMSQIDLEIMYIKKYNGVIDANENELAYIMEKAIHKKSIDELEREKAFIDTELNKLTFAIEALEQSQKEIVLDLYVERLTWECIASKRYTCTNTISRKRKKAITEIAKLYNFTIDKEVC